MNSKKSSFCYLLSAFLFGGVSVLMSCDNAKDVYNPNHIQEEAKKAFPVKDIDPNQTWETSAICNASVAVNEKTGGTYTIKVYTENPYNTDGNAFLLAKTSVTNGQTVNFKFDIPAALQYIYVMKINSEGYSSAIPVAVENGTAKVTFGEATTRAVETRGASTNTNVWEPSIPDINNTKIFPQNAPNGSKELTTNMWEIEKGANYVIKSNIKNINVNNPAVFYIEGNITLESININGADNSTKIIILPGSTLKMTGGFALGFTAELSIGKGAKLICSSINISNSFGTVYNAGIIETGTYYDSRNNNAAFYNLGSFKFDDANLSNINFYNSGTITGNRIDINNKTNFINAVDATINLTGFFGCMNGTSIAVNQGNINANIFHLEGSSTFYNESTGKVIIKDKSEISSNSSVWNNEGYFKTYDMVFTSSSTNWINKCQLYVDHTLDFNTSSATFIMDAGSYLQCQFLCMNMTRVEMRDKAFINVLEDASFSWNTDNRNGFYATVNENELALLKMAQASVNTTSSSVRVDYSGNLSIACSKHFSIGNNPNNPRYNLKGKAAFTGIDNANIKIPATTCSPGYNSTPDTGGDDKVQTFAYAFEDMMIEAGDYDFNDIVLYVTNPIDGKVKVNLMAAGATKELKVAFKYNGKIETIFSDVYAALGVPNGTITNTGGATGKVATKEIEVGNNFSLSNDGDFFISDGIRDIHIAKFTEGFTPGDAPYAIRVASSTWKWPKESTKITEAYPAFEEWAKDATKEIDWYKDEQSISDKVIGIK